MNYMTRKTATDSLTRAFQQLNFLAKGLLMPGNQFSAEQREFLLTIQELIQHTSSSDYSFLLDALDMESFAQYFFLTAAFCENTYQEMFKEGKIW